jgi:hypothetical protein
MIKVLLLAAFFCLAVDATSYWTTISSSNKLIVNYQIKTNFTISYKQSSQYYRD